MTIAELLAKLRIAPDKRSFDAADKMIGALKGALLALVAVKTGQFFAGMVQQTAELGGKIDDLAQSTGQTRVGLQELAYAGEQGGMTLEDTSGIVTKLSKNIYEAAHGNKELAKSFSRAGVAVRNADGSLRPATDVLEDIADHLAGMPDGTKKTALAMELLGKSGSKAIPLLNAGGDGIRRMREEAHELGAVMSEDAVKSLDEFGDEQAKVKTALIGMRNEAVVALLPTLKEMVAGLLEWVKANRKVIAQKLATIIGMIAGALKVLAKVVGFAVDALAWMGEHVGFVTAAVGGLIAAIAIFRVSSIAAAIASGAAWALAHLPIILLGALIAGVALLVEDVITAFRGGKSVVASFFDKKLGLDFVDTMTRVAGGVKAAFVAVFDFLKAKVDWLIEKGEWLGRKLHQLAHGSEEWQSQYQKQYLGRMGLEGRGSEVFGDRDLSSIDSFTSMPDMPTGSAAVAAPKMDTWAASAGPSFSAAIKVEGGNGTPEQIAQKIADTIEVFWSDQMRKASVGAGTR